MSCVVVVVGALVALVVRVGRVVVGACASVSACEGPCVALIRILELQGRPSRVGSACRVGLIGGEHGHTGLCWRASSTATMLLLR